MEILHRMWVDVVHYTQANFQLGGPYGLPSLAGAMIVAWVLCLPPPLRGTR